MADLFLDGRTAERILKLSLDLPKAPGPAGRHEIEVEISLDLYLHREIVRVSRSTFTARGMEFSLEPLKPLARRSRKIFRHREPAADSDAAEPWEALETRKDAYIQLVSVGESAPCLEIGGIKMHLTSGTDPFRAAGEMAQACVRPGDRVLDTCGGLGYTAIQAARLGAVSVYSTELSEGVLYLRDLNPWSRLAEGLPIQLVMGDVFASIARHESASYDAIVHDPPRFSLARELYGEAFYICLNELLTPGGKLYHYTGDPYSRSHGRDFASMVLERLSRSGFRARRRPELQGVLAEKPRVARYVRARGRR